ncbi:hypothetical protein D3C78_1208970 [compost metagenome]
MRVDLRLKMLKLRITEPYVHREYLLYKPLDFIGHLIELQKQQIKFVLGLVPYAIGVLSRFDSLHPAQQHCNRQLYISI